MVAAAKEVEYFDRAIGFSRKLTHHTSEDVFKGKNGISHKEGRCHFCP